MTPVPRTGTRLLVAIALGWSVVLGPVVPPGAADEEAPVAQTGCSALAATATVVPVQSLAQGNVFDHGPPRSILLVSQRPDSIVSIVGPAQAEALDGVDLTSHVLVALFVGRWPQEGHQVTIQSAWASESEVCLDVRMIGPGPGQDAADAETYPYHVVALPLAALPQGPGVTWTARASDGAVIASAMFP